MGNKLTYEGIVLEEPHKLGKEGVSLEDGGLGEGSRQSWMGEDMDHEGFLLSGGEAENVQGNFSSGDSEDRGHCDGEGMHEEAPYILTNPFRQ